MRAALLGAALAGVAGAVDVRLRPATPEVKAALVQALGALSTGDVSFRLLTDSGPKIQLGGAPTFNPDEASRTVTRGGEQVIEINPKGPVSVAQAVRGEVEAQLGLPAGAAPKDVRARYGGADLNGDGKIDLSDFAVLADSYGKTGSGVRGDLNGDGKVDGADLKIFAKFYSLP